MNIWKLEAGVLSRLIPGEAWEVRATGVEGPDRAEIGDADGDRLWASARPTKFILVHPTPTCAGMPW